MHGFLDWFGRVVMLVLAGMITLSIIGAIAALPSGNLETAVGLAPRMPVQEAEAPPGGPAALPPEGDGESGMAASSGAPGSAAPALPPRPEAVRWLETIAYAMLALVGLAALATLILWRGLSERRRIADALEDLAARRG